MHPRRRLLGAALIVAGCVGLTACGDEEAAAPQGDCGYLDAIGSAWNFDPSVGEDRQSVPGAIAEATAQLSPEYQEPLAALAAFAAGDHTDIVATGEAQRELDRLAERDCGQPVFG
jgi:hypothetical protein